MLDTFLNSCLLHRELCNITNPVVLLGDCNSVEDCNFCDFNVEYNFWEVIIILFMNLFDLKTL